MTANTAPLLDKPDWMPLAKAELGTKEIPGPGSNPGVEQYYIDAVHLKQRDDVPWCAAFVGAVMVRSGRKSSRSLLARSYAKYGTATEPRYGCIVVFTRGRGMGHVAFFIRDNGDGTIKVLGGNQSDQVSYANYPKSRVIAYRWPPPRVAKSATPVVN